MSFNSTVQSIFSSISFLFLMITDNSLIKSRTEGIISFLTMSHIVSPSILVILE